MSKARLTRQEVTWLLAQEARGAASALRQGVSKLSDGEVEISDREGAPLETTLDALDDAINLWAGLEHAPTTRGRRGRVDIAAMLCEVAPGARISIEPGEGTEVFGDENDVRRLINVLISHQSGGTKTTGDVHVRRVGDWIRLSIELGPDLSASEDIERRWLSRMAMRLGGRVELEGSTETLVLPADAASDHAEVATLRKELQEAQELGETYARELAAAFSDIHSRPSEPSALRPPQTAELELLRAMSAIVVRAFKPLLSRARKAADNGESATSLADVTALGLEFLSELEHVVNLDTSEDPTDIDVRSLVRDAVESVAGRAHARDVRVEVDVPTVQLSSRPRTVSLLLRALLQNAVAATPRGGEVALTAVLDGGHLVLTVVDGGSAVPASVGAELLAQQSDPASFGRPGGVALLVARVTAESLGGDVTVDGSPGGATQTTARLPASR